MHALFGKAEPVPAENTWTHLLPNLAMVVARRIAFSWGTDALAGGSANHDAPEHHDPDQAAGDDFFTIVQGIRRRKLAGYIRTPENLHQLGAYVIILDRADSSLLYPLLRDPADGGDNTDKPAKLNNLELLLDPDTSKVSTARKVR